MAANLGAVEVDRDGHRVRNTELPPAILLDRRDSGHGVHRHIHDAFFTTARAPVRAEFLRLRFDERRGHSTHFIRRDDRFLVGHLDVRHGEADPGTPYSGRPAGQDGWPMSWSFHLSVFISA